MLTRKSTFSGIFAHRADRHGARTALTWLGDGHSATHTLTYGELRQQSLSAAAGLRARFNRGERVLIAMDGGLLPVVALLGCWEANIIPVPCPMFPSGSAGRRLERFASILGDCSASGILVPQRPNEDGAAAEFRTTSITDLLLEEPSRRRRAVAPVAEALIQYTSGSTAAPKGVVLTHANILRQQAALQATFGHTEHSVIVGWLPLFHDMGLIGNVLNTLYSGAHGVLLPPATILRQPLLWLKAIAQFRGNTSGAPNFAYEACVQEIAEDDLHQLDLGSWKIAFNGSEMVRASTLEAFAKKFSACGFARSAFLSCYGLAESTLAVTATRRGRLPRVIHADRAELQKGRVKLLKTPGPHTATMVSSGRAVLGQDVNIVRNGESRPCPEGAIGEIVVTGGSVARRYWGTHGGSRKLATSLHALRSRRVLRTGDLGFLHRGELFVCGRQSDEFKIRGRTIHPTDVEFVAAQTSSMPGCLSATFALEERGRVHIVLCHEAPRGRDNAALAHAARLMRAAVLEACSVAIDRILFVPRTTLPRTSSGKVMRAACRDALSSGTLRTLLECDFSPRGTEHMFATPAPGAAVGQRLVQLLSRHSGFDEETVRGMSVADLGLDSLAIASLHASLVKEFGATLDLERLLACSTVSELASAASLPRRASLPLPGDARVTPAHATQPLSRGQQALYFLSQLRPRSSEYTIARAMTLAGVLDVRALREAVSRLHRRHPILAGGIFEIGGEPRMIMPKPGTPDRAWSFADLSAVPREVHAERCLAHVPPIALPGDSLFRILLMRLAPDRHVLMIRIHHVVCDLWSLATLWEELQALYRSITSGVPAALAAAADYRTFVARQAQATRASSHQRALASCPLPGDAEPLRLAAQPRPRSTSGAARRTPLHLDAAALQAFRTDCARNGCTLSMGLLAAYATALARIAAARAPTIGCTLSGRRQAEWNCCVGYFVNVVPVRVEFGDARTFSEALESARTGLMEAFNNAEHPEAPGAGAARRPDGSHPLYRAMLTFQSLPRGQTNEFKMLALGEPCAALAFAGLPAQTLALPANTAQADVHVVLTECAGELRGYLESDPDSVDSTVAESIAACMMSEMAATAPADAGDSALAGVVGQFWKQVQATPQAVALEYEAGTMSYAELGARARGLSDLLGNLSVGTDDAVAIYLDRSPGYVVAVMGILSAGAAFLPLDFGGPPARLADMLRYARARVLVAGDVVPEGLPAGVRVISIHDVARATPAPPQARIPHASLAYVMYTSGSTGRPKGVMTSHAAIANRIDWMQREYRLRDGDKVLHKTPATFDVSVWEVLWPLCHGQPMVIAPAQAHRDPERLEALMRARGVTVAHFVPTMGREFFRWVTRPLDSLRLCIFSGEALPEDVAAAARRCAQKVHNLYGPTEAAIDVTYWDCASEHAGAPPIGLPISNLRLYVLTPDLRRCSPGETGELYISGIGLARGYIGNPALTADRFLPDPFSPELGARMYRTGDQGAQAPDGAFEYRGRMDTQVKLYGQRIELGEIEQAIRGQAAVDDCAVSLLDGRLHAALVPQHKTEVPISTLRDALARVLPVHMIPKAWTTLAALPLTPSGKLDRKMLVDILRRGGAPATAHGEAAGGHAALVQQLFTQTLNGAMGPDDNFFGAGGDSILAIRVIAALRERGFEVSVADLYQHQTASQLADALRARTHCAKPAYQPFSLLGPDRSGFDARIEDAYPLTYLQQGLVYHSDGDDDAYEVYVTSLTVRSRFDPAAWDAAVRHCIARHPVLRTSFDLHSRTTPVQLVHSHAVLPVELVDLRSMAADAQSAVIDAWLLAARRQRFDWSCAPLLRLCVHVLAEDSFRLSIAEPFLDGWSIATLLSELLSHFGATLRSVPLPATAPPATPFAEFVRLELEAVESAATRAFWTGKLAGAKPCFIRSRGLQRDGDGARGPIQRYTLEPSESLSRKIITHCHTLGLPLKSLMLAVQCQVVSLFSGMDDVLVGLMVNGRPEAADGDQVIGGHLNVVPVRASVTGQPWTSLLQQMYAAETELLPHRRFPLVEIQRCHEGGALFDTMLNFTHFHVYRSVEEATGVRIEDGYASEQTYFPLTTQCHVDFRTGKITLAFDHVPQLDRRFVQQFAQAFDAGLRAACGLPVPDRAPPREPRWDSSFVAVPSAIHEHARHAAAHPAVVSGDERVTYGDLASAAGQVADALHAMGVREGDCVAVLIDRSCSLVLALAGVLYAGAAYCPIDPAHPAERIERMLQVLQPRAVVTLRRHATLLASRFEHVLNLDSLPDPSGSGMRTPHVVAPQSLAYVVFTSGSTGVPKGVEITHQGVGHLVRWHLETYALSQRDAVGQVASMGFDAFGWELWPALAAGSTVHLAPEPCRTDAARLAAWLRDARISVTFVPTPLLEALLEEDLSQLSARALLTGGDVLRKRPQRLPFELYNHYGPTEATVVATFARVADIQQNVLPPIGLPIGDTSAYVLDAQLEPLPPYAVGMLHVGGVQVARGYRGDRASTARLFLPDPFSTVPGRRMYATGDLVYCDSQGDLHYVGRADRQVKIAGIRTELGEVEAALAGCKGVASCTVLLAGEGASAALVAYVVPSGRFDADHTRARLRRLLPASWVPAKLVTLSQLPLTPNGKLDRASLLSMPLEVDDSPANDYPDDDFTRTLADIWQEVLRCAPVRLSSNFVDLGGHSLLAMQMTSRVRRALNCDVAVKLVFDYPTLGEYSRQVLDLFLMQADPASLAAELHGLGEPGVTAC
jgi:nonribosomal peptide synthetase protein BlmVI